MLLEAAEFIGGHINMWPYTDDELDFINGKKKK